MRGGGGLLKVRVSLSFSLEEFRRKIEPRCFGTQLSKEKSQAATVAY